MTITDKLSKYDTSGNLVCIICNIKIKSDLLWKSHILSKEHKLTIENIESKSKINNSKQSDNGLPNDFFKSTSNSNITTSTNKQILTKPVTSSASILSSTSSIPAGFFDDPEKEIQVRNIKLTKYIKLEIKLNDIKEKENKLLEEKQLQQFEEMLIPVREAEEEMIQKDYKDRFDIAKQKGADIKRKLEEFKEAQRLKKVKSNNSDIPVTIDWKSRSF